MENNRFKVVEVYNVSTKAAQYIENANLDNISVNEMLTINAFLAKRNKYVIRIPYAKFPAKMKCNILGIYSNCTELLFLEKI